MRIERIGRGRRSSHDLAGAVLARDVVAGEDHLPKGRRLTAAEIARIAADGPPDGVTVIVPEPGDIHEDEAALRLASAMAGPGLELRGPSESRVDLVAAVRGVARVRARDLERLARIDPIGPFSILDGQVVEAAELVASVKVGPHVVPADPIEAGEALLRRTGPIVSVLPFVRRRIGALVKESLNASARTRFERSVAEKVAWLGSDLVGFRYASDDPADLDGALAILVSGPGRAEIVLAAGAGSSDPADPLFLALERAGGRIIRHGVPAHPGSMLWLGRVRRTTILGLPSCGAYSRAGAADLLLPWILAGAPASARTAARLAHGGVLSRAMRFRFPAYAREVVPASPDEDG